jgi:hypothetical protein
MRWRTAAAAASNATWAKRDCRQATLAAFNFEATPMLSKAQIMALASGDVWLKTGTDVLPFGPPGGGKSHLSAALGLALVENGWRVLFTRTTELVHRLQVARRELALESASAKLDRYDLLILDDIAYVSKDQAETSVLFELIAARYTIHADYRRPAVRRVGQDLPRPGHDPRRHRPARPSRHHPRDERRKLPPKSRPRSQARPRTASCTHHIQGTR